MTSRERITQARHVMLLSNDAPVLNRCAREEAHLKDSLAQTNAACALVTQRSRAAAAHEERSRESRLQAQLKAMLSGTPDIVFPSFATEDFANVAERDGDPAAANGRTKSRPTIATWTAVVPPSGLKLSSSVSAGGGTTPAASPPCVLGFPDVYESSGFRSMIHWASVAYDETFLTAYGPRRCRKDAQAKAIAGAGGSAAAREAQPHRLMTAVACYLLNEVLCADAAMSELWREKLRQPIFDAIFSSYSIAMGQERSRAQRGGAAGDAAIADAIVHGTIGPTSSLLPGAAADDSAATSFPPRTNSYTTRDDFASLRLWIEEVAVEQREKATVCQRVRSLQHALARRQMADHLFQRRARQAELQTVFTVWRAHTRQCRANRSAMERYVVKRNHRHVEEIVFLRWRRFTLRSKVEALQRLVLNIAASRDGAAREHAAALRELQDRLSSERRQHLEETFERDTLQAQVLDSHAMEVDALQLMLQMEKLQTAEFGKWAMRWERVAKTFRPAKPCPAVPRPLWTMARALLSSEEALAAMILMHSRDQQVSSQTAGALMLQARQQVEQLLLLWVNSIMEESPQASTWIPVDVFTYGHRAHPQGILLSQKQSLAKKPVARRSGRAAGTGSSACEFNIYTLMCLVRELRRRYAKTGLMQKMEDWGTSDDASASGPSTLTECYHELAHLIVAQTCGGLYPPLLVHCPSFSLWFTPEGVFSAPVSQLEGPTRRRRQQQHITFLWLLASLLVGHVQMMWMPPFGDRVAPLIQPPTEEVKTLECKHEAEMMKLAQISFPMRHIAPPAGSTAAPRGSSVVAPNTLLPKKRSAARSTASFSAHTASKASSVAAGNADGGAAGGRGLTLEAALRARCKGTRGSTSSSSGSSAFSGKDPLPAADESLTDIGAFLGMEPPPVQPLKEMAGANGSEGEGDEDRWVNGLLHQLFKAEDAEAQLRRTVRLEGGEAPKGNAEGRHTPPAMTPPASAFADKEDGGCGRQYHDNAAAADIARPIHGDLSKTTAILTGEQLRLLRSLPGRSCGFDTPRPIAVALSEAATETREPLTTNPSTASHASSASLYSFLLNTLDDTVARRQWHGLVRIVTSLVVRFHVLDNPEEDTRRAAVLATAKEGYEERKGAKVSHSSPARSSGSSAPSSATRLPPVSVGCSLTMATTDNVCDGAAGAATPTRGGRRAARPVSTALSQPSQPPPLRGLANKAQQCLVRTHGSPHTNVASYSGATPSLEGMEHAVPVSWAQELPTAVTSVVLGEELCRRVACQTSFAQDSLGNSSPVGYSREGAPSFEPSRFADSPNGTEATTAMAPPPSAEVHTPVIPTAAILPAGGDGCEVEQYAAESTEYISGVTPKDRSAFPSAVTGKAGTRAITTKARRHEAAEVLASEQGADHAPPQAPAPSSSEWMRETAQQFSKGRQEEHTGAWLHGSGAFSEAHARVLTRPPSPQTPMSMHAGQSTVARTPFTGLVCLRETENVLPLRPASALYKACSYSYSAPSSCPNDTCWAASGSYVPPQTVTMQIPLPSTLPAPTPAPPPPSAPGLEYSPDPVMAPAELQNPLSPLIVHATHPPQSEGQKRRKDCFQMKP
ncbi:hypothetical protein GH5_00436 [Leishmania sp. Ghana 2012 LV757]|uniref:hypothetical protein n=1 Tax=Leishmania sp. Ghana 2012 LV757 TaxID=2803181 RepID=UPI001B748CB7|nr:hypothetical protein GH5_00436 [Leishmania sp. Ghana 2012 LV757]